MPELPEVETVVRELRAHIRRRTLQDIRVYDSKLRQRTYSTLKGMSIIDVVRAGKQVVLVLRRRDTKETMFFAIHLRMSGRLIWSSNNNDKRKHLRAALLVDSGRVLFIDPRRFGTMKIYSSLEEITRFGIDPLSKAHTEEKLTVLLRGSKQNIKHFLMRQDKLVGIGNIYASEILFGASISPKRRVDTLTKGEIRRLFIEIQKVLKKAIICAGTTFSDFQNVTGESGRFQNFLKTYDREGLSCKRCKTSIQRIAQQGRSTFYCPQCQK